MDYEKYFKVLENHNKMEIKKEDEECEHTFLIDYEYHTEICDKCGLSKPYVEEIKPNTYLNKKFHLTTIIVGGKSSKKNYMLKKFQKYSNYNYKEVTMLKSFKEIKKICKHFNLNNKIYDVSISKYKNIFLDLNISSRDKIKKSVYVYCIIYGCNFYNIEIDVKDILNYIRIEKKHYLKALKKIDKNNIYFVKEIIDEKIDLCLKKGIEVNKKNIYEDYYRFVLDELKFNKNSLILFLFYKNLDITDEDFILLFNTTKITLKKFNNLKKIK